MNMAESPVVDGRAPQIGQRAGTVGRMLRLVPHAAVQEAYTEAGPGLSAVARGRFTTRTGKTKGQVLSDLPAPLAQRVNRGDTFTGHLRRDSVNLIGADERHLLGPGAHRRPSAQRIMIAVDHERVHSALGQTLHSLQEAQLRPHPPLLPVVKVAGQKNKSSLPLESHSDQVVEGLQGGVA